MSEASEKTRKLCFVTIGATASFDGIIEAVLSAAFLTSLINHGYTDLLLQYGKTGLKILDSLHPANAKGFRGFGGKLAVAGFDFDAAGLSTYMRCAKGGYVPPQNARMRAFDEEGCVVSHAGSGSILDALRAGVPCIVVPNPKLLDNHQDELAEELSRLGYVVHGRLDAEGQYLANALQDIEVLRRKGPVWPPVDGSRKTGDKGLVKVLDEEMGFTILD